MKVVEIKYTDDSFWKVFMKNLIKNYTKEGAETYNVAFVTYDNFCNFKTFIKEGFVMLNELRSGCGMGEEKGVSPKGRS
ncbi:hypothetical protein [Archaeoglobus sp.]